MKRVGIVVLAAIAALFVSSVALSEDEAKVPAGQKAFVDNKCNSCHTVAAAKIELRKKEEGEEAEETAEKEEKAEKKPVDLSAAGMKHKAEWLSAYLMKTETLNEKKHKKKFRGSEEDLKEVVAWLGTLKDEKAEKAAEGEGEEAKAKTETKTEESAK